ncbi:hypothetical protein CPAR01_15409 [Colletotrichum paranaense]|uniref:Uncharacterized protein n=1 Tax=Colletotrichum paranaense TaxID=1914294 RepID=A0ABQ9RZ26_9PEZI|nr:uncharacterized protein CPAR01_15409 [Colletotrichum paranaense]KAK1519916.1 hypothetical protein CPAR01_15409 [Colletotrichum paranaense]
MAANHNLGMDFGSYAYQAGGPRWPQMVYNIYNSKDSAGPITVELPTVWRSESIDAQKDCYDPKFLFHGSAPNSYGCAAIATSALLVQNHDFVADKTAKEANSKINFGSLDKFNASRVIQAIVSCVEASCTGNNPLGDCDPEVAKLKESQAVAGSMDVVLSGLTSLCSFLTKEPEADIAGPGIAVSYYIQVALCIWFFIFCGLLPHQPDSSTFFSMLRVIRWFFRKCRRRSDAEIDRLRSTLTHLRSTRFSVALCSAMVEFQETQAFFVMAIEAATLTMVIMNSESLAIRVDVGAAKAFATANTLLVLITQAIMQRRGMYWWYTFILTVIVYVLCAIIQMLSLPAPSSSTSDHDLELVECGGQRSILQTCMQFGNGDYYFADGYLQSSDKSTYFVIYTAVMVFLTADHLGNTPRLRKVKDLARQALEKRKIRIPAWVFTVWSVLGKLLWAFLVLIMATSLFANVAQVHDFVRSTMGKKKQWTFGQVVAVLVWAPVLSKYIYYNIFGIELGVGKRIDNQYKVVLNEENPSLTPPGAQERFNSSRNLVNDSSYISLSTIGDGHEDQRPARAETRSFSGGVKRKPLPPRTDTELPR